VRIKQHRRLKACTRKVELSFRNDRVSDQSSSALQEDRARAKLLWRANTGKAFAKKRFQQKTKHG
jgi:hypothetical protein